MFTQKLVIARCITFDPIPDIRLLLCKSQRTHLGNAESLHHNVASAIPILWAGPKDAGALATRLQQCERHIADVILGGTVGLGEAKAAPVIGSNVRDTMRCFDNGCLIARALGFGDIHRCLPAAD